MQNYHPFTQTLLLWFSAHARPLPWRNTRNPYAIWLSEIILQQTRIAQGEAYWHKFMQQYPTVEDLATATEDEVLRLWQGLGYYSRARNLHQAAKEIVKQGTFPNTFAQLKKLKGVGDYTAAAIASIAFHEDVASVDGNVYRVLARHFNIHTPIDTTQGKKYFAQLAQQLLPTGRASDFNQALMDFGAVVCTPTSPACEQCPIATSCEALHTKNVTTLPIKQKKIAIKTRYLNFMYIRCNHQVAIAKRSKGDIWQGLWQLLNLNTLLSLNDWQPTQPTTVIKQWPNATPIARNVKQVLTHQHILGTCYLLELTKKPQIPPNYLWIDEDQLAHYAFPKLLLQFVKSINKNNLL